MKRKNYFIFDSKFLSTSVQVSLAGLGENNDVNERYNNLIKGHYEGFNFPLIFKQDYGKNYTDILGTGWPNFYLISIKLKRLFESNDLKGWDTFPVKLYDKKNNEVYGYYGFSVKGSSGPISFENSQIIEKRRFTNSPLCRFYKGFEIELLNDFDFFIPSNFRATIVNNKVADVIKNNKVTNVRLEKLSDVEIEID